MRRFIAVAAAVLALSGGLASCKIASGPFGASGGLVACFASMIDAAGRDAATAHAGVSLRVGSCNGTAAVADRLDVTVINWYFRGGLITRTACSSTLWTSLANTSGFSVSTDPHNVASAPIACRDAQPGARFQAQAFAKAEFNGQSYESDGLYTEVEEWSLPGAQLGEHPHHQGGPDRYEPDPEWVEIELHRAG